jgi:hypothetical protein
MQLENLIAVKLRQHSGGPTALFLRYDVDGKGVITFDQFKLAVNAVRRPPRTVLEYM